MSMDEAGTGGKRPEMRKKIEETLSRLGGEEGVRARHEFRHRIREIMEEFRDTFLDKPGAGPAERRVYVNAAAQALDDAVIQFQGLKRTGERKI